MEGKESSKKTKIPPKNAVPLVRQMARPIAKAFTNRHSNSDGDDAGVDSTAAAGGAPSSGLNWMAGGIVGYSGGDSTGNTGVPDTNGGYTSGGYSSSGGADYGGGDTGGGYSGGGDSGGYSGGGDTGGSSGPSGGTD